MLFRDFIVSDWFFLSKDCDVKGIMESPYIPDETENKLKAIYLFLKETLVKEKVILPIKGMSCAYEDKNHELSDVVFLIVGPKKMDILEKFSPDPDIVIREERVLTKERFDLYLFVCDGVVFHKFQAKYEAVILSSFLSSPRAYKLLHKCGCLQHHSRVLPLHCPPGLPHR